MLRKIVVGAHDPRRSLYKRWQCNICGCTVLSSDFYHDVKVWHSMTDFVFDYTCPGCGKSAMGFLGDVVAAYYTDAEVEEMGR